MQNSGYVQVTERKVSPPNPLVRARFAWPFEPRKGKKLTSPEVAEIKVLLAHVKAGNMEISDIADAFSVSPDTVRKIRDRKTHKLVKAAGWIAPAKKRKR
jgi:hypothetical protein